MTSNFADPKTLQPNPWNTNRMSPEAEVKLQMSLMRHGMFKPVIVREVEDGLQILGGQHRVEQAIPAGMAVVPIFNLGPIDDTAAKEIGILDNSRYGFDDGEKLGELLRELGESTDLTAFMPLDTADLAIMDKLSKLDLDTLELEEEDAPSPTAETPRAPKTHVVMRFKVPVDDVHVIEEAIKRIISEQELDDSDSMVNAGDAMVILVNSRYKDSD